MDNSTADHPVADEPWCVRQLFDCAMQLERGHGSFSSGASFDFDIRGINRAVGAKRPLDLDECADGDQSLFLLDMR